MRKLVFILLLFPILINSQVYTAGTIYSYFFDIYPDKSLNYYYSSGSSGLYLDSIEIDINNDFQNDIKLKKRQTNSPGGGSGNVMIMSLNPNVLVRSSPTYTQAAHPLNFGDTINSVSAIWSNSNKYIAQDASTPPFSLLYHDTLWWSANDNFAGISFVTSADTSYGWIRINCQPGAGYNINVLIKDFSFQSSCHSVPSLTTTSSSSLVCSSESVTLSVSGANTYTWSTNQNGPSIVITPTVTTNYTVNGTTSLGCLSNTVLTQSVNACIGIKELEKLNGISIYPNPSNDKLILQNIYGIEIKKCLLHDVTGKEISIKQSNNEIDTSTLPEGLYFLQVRTEEGTSTKKIVIQH